MLCRQCEQTAQGKGCTIRGVCGKTSETAVLQDLLVYSVKGIGVYGKLYADIGGGPDKDTDRFVQEALFSTVTNVNFNPEKLASLIHKAFTIKEKLAKNFLSAYQEKNKKAFSQALPQACFFKPADSLDALIGQGARAGILADTQINEDIRSLREILLYGLKGMAAYADHAQILGKTDAAVDGFFYKALAALTDDSLSANDYVALIMEFGKVNLRCMEVLDQAHTGRFGHPVPTKVSLGVRPGPAIIVSGHDLLDLEQLLIQTEGSGVNVYTHGEMLPAHGYPQLRRFMNLAGHFGTAWQNQQKEFDEIPAAILMTTNCIQEPRPSYQDRIFTTGLVSFPGVAHIMEGDRGKKDFSSVIAKAKELGGFTHQAPGKEILVGFGHQTVLGVADKVIDAVKAKSIRHFFLIGGCDGAKPGRNYYTEFAQKVPADCLVLTLACGKFRFNTHDFGTVAGLPRLLDCGQCNDAYSAIKIALALADAFKCSVNELPLSLVLSWYEQKAVCILLTLFSLGIKNIRLGPTLPAFISSNVLKILVDTFDVKPISTPEADLKAILG